MTHTYTPYTIEQMMADTAISEAQKQRIRHLVEVRAVKITARNDGDTFVAYSGSVALTYKAVLQVDILPGQSGGLAVAIELQNRPADYLARVAEILTKYAYLTKRF